jgi:glycosyltransferase involved in cell wall biosynthesis
MEMEKLSVVVPVMNEEENVSLLIQKIREALKSYDYEIVLVDDGSRDNTVNIIREQAGTDIKLIVFAKNFGQTSAMAAGIKAATGDYIITMDGDLQNDPEDIPMMMEQLKEQGVDVVAGIRKNRKDNVFIRKIPSKLANFLIRRMTGESVTDNGCSLRVYKSGVAKSLNLYGELHRFIYILAKMEGARIAEVEVSHHPRIHGKSKYGLERTFKVMSDLLLIVFFKRYFQKPIHLFGGLGLISFFIGMIINLYFLVEKIMGQDIWGRPLLFLGIIMTIGGIQLVTTGFIAEIMMRTYYESQDKPTYRIKEIFVGKDKSETKEHSQVAV